MKNTSIFLSALFVLLLGYCLFSIHQLRTQLDKLKTEQSIELNDAEEKEIEVAEVMGNLHRYASKLDLALQGENWELAGFYFHEMEETLEVFEENEVIEDELNLSGLYKSLLKNELTTLDQQIDVKDQVSAKSAMQVVWSSCNECHKSSGHEFIVVKGNSDVSAFPNQEFGSVR